MPDSARSIKIRCGASVRRVARTAPSIWRWRKARPTSSVPPSWRMFTAFSRPTRRNRILVEIVRGGAEAGHAESFAAQFFDAVDFRVNPKSKIGPVGEARHRDDRSAAEHRRDHRIRPGDGGLDVAADQRRNHHRARRNENKIGFDAVFVESADVLCHPQSNASRSGAGITESELGAFRGVALRSRAVRRRRGRCA